MEFAKKYGPWAIVAGASEGTGAAFSRQLAEKGLNLILIARRLAPLDAIAQELRAEFGVECVTASIDLAQPEAYDKILHAAGEREIGLYISNAGADPNGSHFLNRPIQTWVDLVTRNLMNSIRCCHHFGGKMRERGRGGIILVGSGACYGSGPNLATYSGVKAFDLCFSEGLWSELKPHGVDVLNLVMSTTDTPALRELMAKNNLPLPAEIATPEDVAALGLARLPYGPVQNWGLADDEPGYAGTSAAQRRARVEMVAEMSKFVFGESASV
jgi:short-subunit dehydrogenase